MSSRRLRVPRGLTDPSPLQPPPGGRPPARAARAPAAALALAALATLAVPAGAQQADAPPAPPTAAPGTPPAAPGATPAAPPPAAPASAPAAAAPSRPAPAAAQRVEVTGSSGAGSDESQRRAAVASRITIGREEIDRMGDASLGDVLKRLPGVTLGGPPGRGGGQVRMRGMGGGYTQILIDGQRMPPGFSLDTIPPEQIERIEIMRAPVAEHGARAIAGTINVVLRADYRRKASELRIGGGSDGGEPQVGATLQHNGQTEALGYNLTATLFDNHQRSETALQTLHADAQQQPTLQQAVDTRSLTHNQGVFANGRLAFKLSPTHTLDLQPFFNQVRSQYHGQTLLAQSLNTEDAAAGYRPAYTQADWSGRSQWQMGRLLGNWRYGQPASGAWDVKLGSTLSRSSSLTDRIETGGTEAREKHTDKDARDLSVDLTGKYTRRLADGERASAGWELQHNSRADRAATTLANGQPDPSDTAFGDTFQARISRLALWAQSERDLSPLLSYYLGLRWEGIRTHGEGDAGPVNNASAVLTPLAHLVYTLPDAQGEPTRDQLRASLTRSYRSPNTNQLIGRRTISSRAPLNADRSGTNNPDTPDTQGNPQLRPELAIGVEIGYEHYLASGGLLAVNLFGRRITDVIRNTTTLQNVNYALNPRYVSSPVNLGSARAAGVELEAKLRAADLLPTELPLALRGNLTLMWSKLDGVPGPDNQLEGQPPWTLNLGADLPIRGWPLTIGGSWNLTPGFRVRQFDSQLVWQDVKPVLDAYLLWRLNPQANVRLTLANGVARDYVDGSLYTAADGSTQRSDQRRQTWQVVTLRAELRF